MFRAIAETAGKHFEVTASANDKNEHAAQSLTFLYPFGATLNVTKPSVPVLSSGSVCFPLKRPLCALYGCHTGTNSQISAAAKKPASGKICVLGSSHIFHDSYIDKEENRRLLDSLVKYLTDETATLNQIDSEDPDINELNYIQNINKVIAFFFCFLANFLVFCINYEISEFLYSVLKYRFWGFLF